MKITEASDMYNNNEHNYPPKEEDISKLVDRYDFLFTKNKKWYYISSSDDYKAFTSEKFSMHKPVEEAEENWAVINNMTGEIMLNN